jgi:adenylate cyclase
MDELTLLRALKKLQREADEALEQAHQQRMSLAPMLARLLPLLCAHTRAVGAAVCTYDEDLKLRTFFHGIEGAKLPEDWHEQLESNDAADAARPFVTKRLDVAGEDFGVAALCFDHELSADQGELVDELLAVWCEEVDDYLAAIARARHKHQLTCQLSDALKEPVLDNGIDAAVTLLRREIRFDDLILVFRQTDDSPVRYKVFRQGQRRYDSQEPIDQVVEELFSGRGQRLISEGDDEVPKHLGLTRYQQEVLINGVCHRQVVGRLIVGKQNADFSTFDRALLARFSDFLRQRIVDFNREHKQLSQSFAPQQVARLLREPNYAQRYLQPREERVAIMFCDISGFTRLSEQVLVEPQRIGRLVDTWGERAMRAIWQGGGVFDKMVGDCVIGLWGPPFFDQTPSEMCRRALDAARAIREMTAKLVDENDLWPPEKTPESVGVSTGLNYCNLFVGQFGPHEDFTGFSAGMNATARLQGLASCDEILCMESFVDTLGEPSRFSESLQSKVKNVSEPLVYRSLQEAV